MTARCDEGRFNRLTAADNAACVFKGCISDKWVVDEVQTGWSWMFAVAAWAAVEHSISKTVGTLCWDRKAAIHLINSKESTWVDWCG
jgi:hypothetical protein